MDADSFRAFEVAEWERRAAGYDELIGRVTSRLVEPLLDAAGVGGGDRVLDVATGPGYVAAVAASRGARVVGVDVADAMVALARARHPGLEFRQADAESLPAVDAAFDAVVANFLVVHLARPEQAVAEFARVLAPGGRLALTAWDMPQEARFLGLFVDAVAAAGASPAADIPHGPDFFRFAHDGEFAAVLRGAGLERVAVETITFGFTVASVDQLWDGLLAGSVRMAAIIRRQTAEIQARIRAEVERLAAGYRVADGFEIPVSVKLAAGRKPHP